MNNAQAAALAWLRKELGKASPTKKKLDKTLSRDLKSGWLLYYLITIDDQLWGRWSYWAEMKAAGKLLPDPIPQIDFGTQGRMAEGQDSPTRKHLEHCLDLIPNEGAGSWKGWSSWQYFDYFMDWLLFGFGYLKEQPIEPRGCEGASMRLYQTFDLHWLLAYPYDYWGGILAENRHGRNQGFFPTPYHVVEVMAIFAMEGSGDSRIKPFIEPCCGTGRMLLAASNYSLILMGLDISETCVKASLVNGYLYIPPLVKPFKFLYPPEQPEPLEPPEPPDLFSTDPQQQWRFEAVKKRRNQSDGTTLQGLLF